MSQIAILAMVDAIAIGGMAVAILAALVISLVVFHYGSLCSRSVLARGLDANTAFEIVSIDIADIDVGDNIGARLQSDQAEADTRTARARAEARRAEAIANQQEMKAKVDRVRRCWCSPKPKYPRHLPGHSAQDSFTQDAQRQRKALAVEIRRSWFLVPIKSPIPDNPVWIEWHQ